MTFMVGFFLIFIFALCSEAAPPAPGSSTLVARGDYIVSHTSMCDDCHTLRDAHGMPIKSKHLQGAEIIFRPVHPMPSTVWADIAPPISGLTFLTDQQAIVFFTIGKMPDGKFARVPMPPFRFSKSDAEALTAYLKSLPKPAN